MANEYTTEILNGNSESYVNSQEDYSVIYIVRGEISTRINGQLRRASQGEFLLFNPGDSIELHFVKESLVAKLSFEASFYHDKSGINSIYFSMSNPGIGKAQIEHTAGLIKNFWLIRSDFCTKDSYGELGAYYTLLDDLLKNYTIKSPFAQLEKDDYGLQMLRYVHVNYRNHISLEDIAESMFISTPTASRAFLEVAGEKFGNYLRNLRLNKAKQLLENTDDSITKIALDVGFGSPSVMNKIFMKYSGMTPSEYRNKNRLEAVEENDKMKEIFEAFSDEKPMKNQNEVAVDIADSLKDIHSKAKNTNGFNATVLNVGSIKSLSLAQMQNQVSLIIDRLNIKYIRLWGMFAKDLHLLTETPGIYNFSFMDEIFDYIVDRGVNLFLDIGIRGDGARANENTMVFEEQNFLTFQSKEEWLHIIDSFLEHILYRYGKVVNNWIIEVSFFLIKAPYYEGRGYSAIDVWNDTVALIRRKIPEMKIAGPGMPLVDDKELNKMWAEHLLKASQKPDYITCISFPYNDSIRASENGVFDSYKVLAQKEFHRSTNISDVDDRISALIEVLRENNYDGKCVLTDWNYSVSSRNYLQDSTYRAAYTVRSVINSMDNIDICCIFYASDLLSAYSDTSSLLQGSAGIMTRDGIEKPVFHAFEFLGHLGKCILFKNDKCIITSDPQGKEITILMFNFQQPEADYYLLAEDGFEPTEVPHMFTHESESVNIKLSGLKLWRRAKIHQKILNEKHGSVLHHWIQMGCSHNLSREDLQYLKNVSIPETVIEEKPLVDTSLEMDIELDANEVRLIRLNDVGKL